MAFFKFRKGGEEPPAASHQPESVEAMRRRARHRLIGAAVLVLAGVVGFPLLFDTQPRPIAVDIQIDIPDRSKAKPLPPPAPMAAAPAPAPATSPGSAPQQKSEAKVPAAQVPPGQAAIKSEASAASAPSAGMVRPEPRPEPRPTPAVDEGAKARALLEGKAAEAAAAEGRFVVQVGAFADATKAREMRLKVEKAGLKTYTHVTETKEGKRIRVRVGPFNDRSEADKAAAKIKGLDLPAAVLTL